MEMTKNDILKELYRTCLYCELEDTVLTELSKWELEEVFIPMIDCMLGEDYTHEEIESFIMQCNLRGFMSEKTFSELCLKYNLDPIENWDDFPEDDPHWRAIQTLIKEEK